MTKPAGSDVERYAPESHGALIAYEHLHRYALAAALLAGRRVLDLGSGSGYGTALLRGAGARVVGVDVDPGAARRGAPAVCASAVALPFADGSYDAVVCFEVIEHVAAPEQVLDEIARVLGPGGIAIVSTPDRRVYTERAGNRNPFHLHELTREELAAALAQRFRASALYGQSVWAGSWLARLDDLGAPPREAVRAVRSLELAPDARAARAPWSDPQSSELPTPLYLIALCAHNPAVFSGFEERVGSDQLLHDRSQRLLGSHLALAEAAQQRDRELASMARHADNLERELRGDREHASDLERDLGAVREHVGNLERELDEQRRHVGNFERELPTLRDHAGNLERELDEQRRHVGNFERELPALREHADNLEHELNEQRRHSANLEEELPLLRQHAGNLERELNEQRRHVGNFERELPTLRKHAGNLERELDEQRRHSANLEEELPVLRQHAGNLERELDEQRRHAGNFEKELPALRQHAGNLERELDEQRRHAGNLERELPALQRHAGNLGHELDEQRRHAGNLEAVVADLQVGLAAAERGALEQDAALEGERSALHAVRAELARLRATWWLRLGRRLGRIE